MTTGTYFLTAWCTMYPSESSSGRPEVFGFTELNMMKQDPGGDIEELVPVEYALL